MGRSKSEFEGGFFREDKLESIPEMLHQDFVVFYPFIVVEADKGIFLIADGFEGLKGFDHKGKHLGVAIGIVGFEIALADLPGAEKFWGVVF